MLKFKYVSFVGIAGMLALTGCSAEVGGDASEEVSRTEQQKLITDPTGTIQIAINTCSAVSFSGGVHSVSCPAPSGFVLIGGGGQVVGQPEPGALLQASYPVGQSWLVRAKDHVHPSGYQLQAAAIGLKLSGVSQSDLQAMVSVTTDAGTPAGHLNFAQASPPSGNIVLGGGAQATSAGGQQLLFGSAPVLNSQSQVIGWSAASKDHVVSDIGNARSYVISIPACPAGFGGHCLLSYATHPNSTTGTGYRPVTTPGTLVLSGAGAWANHTGAGRLLTAIMPIDQGFGNNNQVFANSKDHEVLDSGSTTADYVYLVRF